jgi:hypothetical protein
VHANWETIVRNVWKHEILFSENFHVWDFEMLVVFKAMRLHVIVNGIETKPILGDSRLLKKENTSKIFLTKPLIKTCS